MSRWRPYRVAGGSIEATVGVVGFCERNAGKLLICVFLAPIPLSVVGLLISVTPVYWAAQVLGTVLILCSVGGYIARWRRHRQVTKALEERAKALEADEEGEEAARIREAARVRRETARETAEREEAVPQVREDRGDSASKWTVENIFHIAGEIGIAIFSFALLGLFASPVPIIVVGILTLLDAPTVLKWILGIASFPVGFFLVWKALD